MITGFSEKIDVIGEIKEVFSSLYQIILIKLVFFTLIILIYSLFVFYSYRFFSKKNIFDFNFREYLNRNNQGFSSFLGFFSYLLEYIIILPILVILWFCFYSIFFLLLAKNLNVEMVLLLSASFIAAIRVSSFISTSLSQDLAKMLPFALLLSAIIGENFFSFELFLERIFYIPSLFNIIPIYLIFIFGIEIFFRFFDAIKIFFLRN